MEPEASPPQSSNGPQRVGESQDAAVRVSFRPGDFPFSTIVQDDGKGESGGWQQAKAILVFGVDKPPHSWECPITIGMPVRTKVAGPIPPSHAAKLSVQIATLVSIAMEPDWNLPTGLFCKRFADGMLGVFKLKYSRLGARVTSP